MDKLSQNKGFTLLEMIVVLILLSIFSTLSLNKKIDISDDYFLFSSQYFFYQTEAMRKTTKVVFDKYQISFNENGNVNKAQTITFPNFKSIIVELGGGRLVYK